LASGKPCLLVDIGKGEYAFFDVRSNFITRAVERFKGVEADTQFSDLNVFLLLVLQAASSPSTLDTGDRRGHIIRLLRGGGKVPISSVCSES
jgi:hypothetical protein